MRNLFWGVALVTIGVLILLDNLGVADFGDMVGTYWPLLVILWGVSILAGRRSKSTTSPPQMDATHSTTTESELLHESNVFGNVSATVTSQNFKGGSLSTIFGDCNLDLTGASIAEGDHEIRIHSVFGNSLVSLPKDAAASISSSVILGDMTILGVKRAGISSELQTVTPAYDTSTRRMKIFITKVFGNVRVV
jgi:lia operon protein LiaF